MSLLYNAKCKLPDELCCDPCRVSLTSLCYVATPITHHRAGHSSSSPQASYGLSTRSHYCVISDLNQNNPAIAAAATCQDQFLGKSLSPMHLFVSSGRVSVTTS
jgi:hypothetical protein